MSEDQIGQILAANIATARSLLGDLEALAGPLEQAAARIRRALLGGQKVLCCGNGGSAADCAHLTTELVGRYGMERRGYAAIDLTANHGVVTALINDYPAEQVFARQVRSFGQEGDVLIAISTSGNSRNIQLALDQARQLKLQTIAFLGKGGGKCKGMADVELIVPSDMTARVQEAHLLLYHTICEAIDGALAEGG